METCHCRDINMFLLLSFLCAHSLVHCTFSQTCLYLLEFGRFKWPDVHGKKQGSKGENCTVNIVFYIHMFASVDFSISVKIGNILDYLLMCWSYT